MIEEIFSALPRHFVAGTVDSEKSYYFSLGEIKMTVLIGPDECEIQKGKTLEKADCVCKTSPDFFCRIWEEGYRPSLQDFLTGKIKSNDPGSLEVFLQCFGKQS
jgi:putative sterol carrier protein